VRILRCLFSLSHSFSGGARIYNLGAKPERRRRDDRGAEVISCSVTPSDTVPSPARDRPQFDIVPKEIEPKDVQDTGAPRRLIDSAKCDNVDLLSKSLSIETCRYPDCSPVDDALSTSTTMRGRSNYPEAADAFPAFSVMTCSTETRAFGRIDMTLSLLIYLCVIKTVSSKLSSKW